MHGKLTVEIEAGNAAASTTEDLARILRKTADKIADRDLGKLEDGGKVMDANGNAVGRWTWTPTPGNEAPQHHGRPRRWCVIV